MHSDVIIPGISFVLVEFFPSIVSRVNFARAKFVSQMIIEHAQDDILSSYFCFKKNAKNYVKMPFVGFA